MHSASVMGGSDAHVDAFRASLRRLHREKDRAYGTAWKKRGEVLGVLANIARKVDRIESALTDSSDLRDESLLDTVVDLFVYTIKYQTFLADADEEVATVILAPIEGHQAFSEGPAGFERLLSRTDFGSLTISKRDARHAAGGVLSRFGDLEKCFDAVRPTESPISRLAYARGLAESAVELLGAIRTERPDWYRAFLDKFAEGDP